MSRLTRRHFLATLGLSGAGAAAAALVPQSPATHQPAGQPGEEKPRSRGYKVTAHVRNYYRTARV